MQIARQRIPISSAVFFFLHAIDSISPLLVRRWLEQFLRNKIQKAKMVNDSARNRGFTRTVQGAVAQVKLGLGYILRGEGEAEGVPLFLPKQWGIACRYELALVINSKVRDVIHRPGNIMLDCEIDEAFLASGHLDRELLGMLTDIDE